MAYVPAPLDWYFRYTQGSGHWTLYWQHRCRYLGNIRESVVLSPFVGATYHLVLKSITWREFFAIIKAIATWCSDLANKNVLLKCDNEAVCYMVNSGTSRDPESMTLIRTLFFICAKFNIECKCQHIPGITNIGSDHRSRNRVAEFYAMSTRDVYTRCLHYSRPWCEVVYHAMSTRNVYTRYLHSGCPWYLVVYTRCLQSGRPWCLVVYMRCLHAMSTTPRRDNTDVSAIFMDYRPYPHQRTKLYAFIKTDYNELLVWSLAHFDCFISAEIDANWQYDSSHH